MTPTPALPTVEILDTAVEILATHDVENDHVDPPMKLLKSLQISRLRRLSGPLKNVAMALQPAYCGATETGPEEIEMNTKPMKFRDSLSLAALALAILVLLPLVAVLAFVMRAGLFAGALGALLVGLTLFAVSPRFREWFGFQMDPGLTYNGLRLDTGVALDAAHGWARFEGCEATVGADDLVQAVLGPVDEVELPLLGSRVRRGDPLFRLRRGERSVAVTSPITGTVVHANRELSDSPQLINDDPFAEGWAVRLGCDDPKVDRGVLLRGREARRWFRGEVDRLLGDLSAGADGLAPAPALPDGGELVEGLHSHIDDEAWARICAGYFAPAAARSLS